MTPKGSPLTVMAFLILPFEIAILYVRKIQIEDMLRLASVDNIAPVPFMGFGLYGLVGVAMPVFQMIAFSAFFLLKSANLRRRHGHLRTLAMSMWITVSMAELAICVALPEHRAEALARVLFTVPLMMMDNFGGAIVLEHLLCPGCAAAVAAMQKVAGRFGR